MLDSKELPIFEDALHHENRLWNYIKACMLCYPEQIICDNRIAKTFCQMVEEAEDFSRKLTEQKYGIYCRSDVLTVKALLACLAANVIAVPLSNRYGDEHHKRIIEAIQINTIISDEEGQLRITKNGTGKIEKELGGISWILSTSGSCGVPKGVMLSEEAVYQNLKASEEFFCSDHKDILLANRGFYHCSSLTGELMMSLIRGVKICCRPIGFDPYLILNQMESDQITMYSGTPTVFYQLCRTIKRKISAPALKYCNVGGEAMDAACRDKILNTLQKTKVVHSYGMTETCSRATYYFMQDSNREACCVGNMISCMESVIADEKGNEAAQGQKGEILIKGSCIMNGYYADKKLTDTVLHKDGWMKTGDIGFKDKEGLLYSCGRKDNMVIRGGVNIYPEEMEHILKEHPLVENAKVTRKSKDNRNPQLHAKVQLIEPYRTDCGKLAEICKSVFSGYQMPDTIELVNSLVFSQIGKTI